MGAGDGRAFLRAALARTFGEDEVTGEMNRSLPLPRPSGVVDRFARLRGDNDGADGDDLESGTVLAAGAAGSDDDDDSTGER